MPPWGCMGLTLFLVSIAPESLEFVRAEIYDLGNHVSKENGESGLYSDGAVRLCLTSQLGYKLRPDIQAGRP